MCEVHQSSGAEMIAELLILLAMLAAVSVAIANC